MSVALMLPDSFSLVPAPIPIPKIQPRSSHQTTAFRMRCGGEEEEWVGGGAGGTETELHCSRD